MPDWVCNKITVNLKDYDDCSEWRCGDCDKIERDKGTWVKVRKGTRLTNKYDPYYIELSNAYFLLAYFSDNPSQTYQPIDTDSRFKISTAKRRHENKNDKINKYIIDNKNNDEVLINAAIKLSEDERKTMDKHNVTKWREVTIDETNTDTHKIK